MNQDKDKRDIETKNIEALVKRCEYLSKAIKKLPNSKYQMMKELMATGWVLGQIVSKRPELFNETLDNRMLLVSLDIRELKDLLADVSAEEKLNEKIVNKIEGQWC